MKYIDADKLTAEIERLVKVNKELKSSRFTEGIAAGYGDILSAIASLQQEQSEVQSGKFVFPKYLYARTKDNKIIDMSYAPQDMTAIEYIRNDSIEQEQPEVDLEKEIEACWQSWLSPSNQKEVEGVLPKTEFAFYAHHFYEFGKNAK